MITKDAEIFTKIIDDIEKIKDKKSFRWRFRDALFRLYKGAYIHGQIEERERIKEILGL